MKGWKVLSVYRKSARVSTHIRYPLNVETKPNIPGSKLFFFKEYEDAGNFRCGYEQIVPCIARNVTKPKYILNNSTLVYDFWQWRNEHPNRSVKEYIYKSYKSYKSELKLSELIQEAPKGTYWAEFITCLE